MSFPARGVPSPGPETRASGLTAQTGRYYLSRDHAGLLVGVGIFPLMIPALIAASSDCRLAGTLLAKSWYGASATPPLASVPT